MKVPIHESKQKTPEVTLRLAEESGLSGFTLNWRILSILLQIREKSGS